MTSSRYLKGGVGWLYLTVSVVLHGGNGAKVDDATEKAAKLLGKQEQNKESEQQKQEQEQEQEQ